MIGSARYGTRRACAATGGSLECADTAAGTRSLHAEHPRRGCPRRFVEGATQPKTHRGAWDSALRAEMIRNDKRQNEETGPDAPAPFDTSETDATQGSHLRIAALPGCAAPAFSRHSNLASMGTWSARAS